MAFGFGADASMGVYDQYTSRMHTDNRARLPIGFVRGDTRGIRNAGHRFAAGRGLKACFLFAPPLRLLYVSVKYT